MSDADDRAPTEKLLGRANAEQLSQRDSVAVFLAVGEWAQVGIEILGEMNEGRVPVDAPLVREAACHWHDDMGEGLARESTAMLGPGAGE